MQGKRKTLKKIELIILTHTYVIAQVQLVILDDMYGNYEFDVKLLKIRIENIHNSVQQLSKQLMLLQNNGQIIQWILKRTIVYISL